MPRRRPAVVLYMTVCPVVARGLVGVILSYHLLHDVFTSSAETFTEKNRSTIRSQIQQANEKRTVYYGLLDLFAVFFYGYLKTFAAKNIS